MIRYHLFLIVLIIMDSITYTSVSVKTTKERCTNNFFIFFLNDMTIINNIFFT